MASSPEYDQTREQPSHPVRVASKWAKVAAILIVGYLGMGKSFVPRVFRG